MKKDYINILKSTIIIGASSFIDILSKIARTKMIALMLGPAGVGTLGLYTSIVATATALFGCGVQASGVRQIAEANSLNENDKVNDIRNSMALICIVMSINCLIIFAIFRSNISEITFGDNSHASEIIILSFAVILSLLGNIENSVLQGLRYINSIAKISVFVSVVGTILTISLIFYFQEAGLVYSLVSSVLIYYIISKYYTNILVVKKRKYSLIASYKQISPLLKLGIAFLASGLLSEGALYIIRTIVNREYGLNGTGYFNAAWSISMLYVGFILNAMVTDYYPRLTSLSKDHASMVQLVNEQSEVALMLSGPIILAMLTFTPIVTYILYSSDFSNANTILRWQIVGTVFKIVSWPMGFIILAKAKSLLFIFTEFSWYSIYILLIYGTKEYFGIESTGISFAIAYILYYLMMLYISMKLIDYRPSRANISVLIIISISAAIIFITSGVSIFASYILGTILASLTGLNSILTIKRHAKYLGV